MNNRTMCGFINSKDVRCYLEETGYAFSHAEAAWLAANCDHLTMEERHSAWREIMDTMPDCRLESVHWAYAEGELYASLHGVLHKLMALDRKYLTEFYAAGEKAVYQYVIQYRRSAQSENYNDSPLFSRFDDCLDALKQDVAEYGSEAIWFSTVRKNYIDDPERNIEVSFNKDCAVTSVYKRLGLDEEEHELECVFNNLWFCFPAPFKKGDIVWHKNRIVEAGPLVVDGIAPERYAETGHKGADSSDMNIWGYFQNDEGELYHEVIWNYMDFEYYPEELLTGKRRILKALSNYLKGEIDIELFAMAYHHILLEEQAKDTMGNWYTKEGLCLAGLLETENEPENGCSENHPSITV